MFLKNLDWNFNVMWLQYRQENLILCKCLCGKIVKESHIFNEIFMGKVVLKKQRLLLKNCWGK